MPLDLTIAIPTFNEEKNLPGCLSAIGKDFASEIVLIDSNSTDNTKRIAERFNVRIIEFNWNGKYPKKRNWYLINHTPKTKWILFLDADEYFTEDFKFELQERVRNESKIGYWLHYSIYFMGKKLKGGYPLRKLALFQVGAALYERIDESRWSNLDMEVHEHPLIRSNLGEIRCKIDHLDKRGITHYVSKHCDYAEWEAYRFLSSSASGEKNNSWTFIQRFKYNLIRSVWAGPVYFMISYIFLGGFIDGRRGLSFAILKMSYFNQIYARIKELQSAGVKG